MRKDALRNRDRLLEAADMMFREHGLGVSVGEIADAAEVGRGTLFRNFPSKDALIAALVAQRMLEAAAYGRSLLEHGKNDAELVFTFVTELVTRQEQDRALMQAVTAELKWSEPELEAAHESVMDVLEQLLERGKQAGSIRPEATATDVLMLMKGLCMQVADATPLPSETLVRHLDLVRAALTTPAYSRPLRGESAPLPTG